MKLEQLRLRSFRNHSDTTINFENATVITGGEGEGKSTIRYGIQIALTGNANFPDARPLVKTGEDEARINATFVKNKSKRVIEKIIPRDPDKPMRTNLMNHKALLEFAGLDPEVAQVLCSTHRFSEMKSEERVRMFSKLVLGDIDLETIRTETTKSIRETLKERAIALLTASDMHVTGKDSLTLYKQLGSAVRSKRATKNIELDLIQKHRTNLIDSLEHCKEQQTDEPTDIDEMTEWLINKGKLDILVPQLEEKKLKKKEIAARKATINTATKALDDPLKEIHKLQKEINKLEQEIEALNLDTLQNNVNLLTSAHGSLEKADVSQLNCPHFGVCEMEPEDIMETIIHYKQIMAKKEAVAVETFNEAEKKGLELGKQLETKNKRQEEIEEEINNSATIEKSLEMLNSAEARLDKELVELEKTVNKLKTSIEGKDFSDAEQITRNAAETISAEKIGANIKTTEEKITAISAEIDVWDVLQKELRLSATWKRLVMTRIGPLEQEIKTRTQKLAGVGEISLSPESVDLVANGNLPFDYLSESERYKVCVAVQQAISNVANAGIVIIDDIRRVVDISPITKMALDFVTDEEATIIVISPDEDIVSKLPEFKHIKIKDGSILDETTKV